MTDVYVPPAHSIGEVVHQETGAHIGWLVASDHAEIYHVQATYQGGLGVMLKGTTHLVAGQLVAVMAVVVDGPVPEDGP